MSVPGCTASISVTASTLATGSVCEPDSDSVTVSLEHDSGNHDDDGCASNEVMLPLDGASFSDTAAELTSHVHNKVNVTELLYNKHNHKQFKC